MTNKAVISMVLVSDSTGETAVSAADAVISQFEAVSFTRDLFPFVRDEVAFEKLEDRLQEPTDLVVLTVAEDKLRERILKICADLGIAAVPLLSPLFKKVRDITGLQPAAKPGRQYEVNQSYLDRISAIDYAISNDDGLSPDYLLGADVILIGVSRTSKTPTCIYLAYQGIRAANVPYVPGQELSPHLEAALSAGVPGVGLVASPSRLSQVRRNRLIALGSGDNEDYADIGFIQDELSEARLFFERFGLPIIDVTRRSIEETAAAIRAHLRDAADA